MSTNANARLLKRAGIGVVAALSALLLCACDGSATGSAASSTTPGNGLAAATPATPSTSPATNTGTGTGSATVSWLPPQQNADGTALTDMAGFRIYYGSSADELSQMINIDTVGITRYVIDNLATGTWYFAVAAFNSSGVEGPLSNIATKTIS
jgi:hypothetical protein